jgi:hypothetical protein
MTELFIPGAGADVPFNPLDMDNLAASIANALLVRPLIPLTEVSKYPGAGIYVIYYHGDHPLYESLSKSNQASPGSAAIYVGKAINPGGRHGGSMQPSRAATPLTGRLREHRDSINAASNLDVEHFTVRWLWVEPLWIPVGESLVISALEPVWNRVVEGFGNHDPGAGRRAGLVSAWDTIHPGRKWAALGVAQDHGYAERIASSVREST